MTREQAEKAIAVGMEMADMCIDQGYNMLYTGEMGIGNTTSTSAIASAFLGLDPQLTVGRGSGINDERMKIKRQVVIDGLAKICRSRVMRWTFSVRSAAMTTQVWPV